MHAGIYIGDLVGLEYLPPFTSTGDDGTSLLGGVNYASAAGGILDETGQHLGERFSLSQQVLNFETNLDALRAQVTTSGGDLNSSWRGPSPSWCWAVTTTSTTTCSPRSTTLAKSTGPRISPRSSSTTAQGRYWLVSRPGVC
jgi:hypothetical protein